MIELQEKCRCLTTELANLKAEKSETIPIDQHNRLQMKYDLLKRDFDDVIEAGTIIANRKRRRTSAETQHIAAAEKPSSLTIAAQSTLIESERLNTPPASPVHIGETTVIELTDDSLNDNAAISSSSATMHWDSYDLHRAGSSSAVVHNDTPIPDRIETASSSQSKNDPSINSQKVAENDLVNNAIAEDERMKQRKREDRRKKKEAKIVAGTSVSPRRPRTSIRKIITCCPNPLRSTAYALTEKTDATKKQRTTVSSQLSGASKTGVNEATS